MTLPISIYEIIRARAESTPDATVILAPGRVPLTYSGLARQASYVRSAINDCGIGREDRVAIVVPNGPELTACFLAIGGAATSAPLNPAYTEAEFEFYLSDLRAKAVVVSADLMSPVRAVAERGGLAILELTPNITGPAGVFSLQDGPTIKAVRPGPAGAEDIGLMLHTSGTTSRPKLVPLTHRNLCTAAMNLAQWFGLTSADRSLTFMPLFHIQGLVAGVLAPLVSGGSIASIPTFDADEFFQWLDTFAPTWYTAGPTYHQAILSRAPYHRDVIARHSLRAIRSSSAPLHTRVIHDLEGAFGVPVIEGYGLTETCLHATSNPLPPGRRKPGTVGIPDGVEIMIEGQNGKAVPPGTVGEVLIAGPSVTRAYENNPEENASAFKGQWFRTGDLGVIDEDGHLKLNGRIKELINRGGEKIAPAEVDRALLEHPDLAEALTFAVPHPTLGEDVAAAIVPRKGALVTDAGVKRFAAERLAPHKVPRKIVVLDALPKGPTGKLQRIGLAQKLGLHETRPKPFMKPKNAIEVHLQSIFEDILGVETVGTTDDFFDLGGDSLGAVRLLLEVKRQFGRALPEDFLGAEGATIEHISQAIRRLEAAPSGSSPSKSDQISKIRSGAAALEPVTKQFRLLDAHDLINSVLFLALFVVAGLGTQRAWSTVSHLLASLHVRTRGSQEDHFRSALRALACRAKPADFERRMLARVYEEIIYTMREHLPAGWHPEVDLRGGEYIEQARQRGRGVILWVCSSVPGDLVTWKSLKGAGFPVVLLRSFIHPYSATAFGRRVLNPVRRRVEDQYLHGTVTLVFGEEVRAVQELMRHLRENDIIAITAVAASDQLLTVPFLGGVLRLGLGAPTLAELNGAPLLPVFVVPKPNDAFEVVVGRPLQGELRDGENLSAEDLARKFIGLLEDYVTRHPTVWRGWLNKTQWGPE